MVIFINRNMIFTKENEPFHYKSQQVDNVQNYIKAKLTVNAHYNAAE